MGPRLVFSMDSFTLWEAGMPVQKIQTRFTSYKDWLIDWLIELLIVWRGVENMHLPMNWMWIWQAARIEWIWIVFIVKIILIVLSRSNYNCCFNKHKYIICSPGLFLLIFTSPYNSKILTKVFRKQLTSHSSKFKCALISSNMH